MECPNDLVQQALFFGSSINFVQGAGGNLSCKENGILWIKASGTRLKDAGTKPIFLPMNLSDTKSSVLYSEDLINCCIDNPTTNAYRPSIETAIHSLLPHKFVAHVHSLGAISRAISSNANKHLIELEIDALKLFIPYSKPGIPLANSILRKLNDTRLDKNKNLIVLLGNHGVIVASEKASDASSIIVDLEKHWNAIPALPFYDVDYSETWSMIYGPNSLNPRRINLLTRGPLTPDQIVFLGSKPFGLWENKTKYTKACLKEDGSVSIRQDLGQDAIEIVSSFVHIARLTSEEQEIVYLSKSDVDELQNWDAEKWRKAQER